MWEDDLPGNFEHKEFEVHRLKGRIPVTDGKLLLVQGVRNIYDMNEAKSVGGQEDAKLVLIGKGVDQPGFQESLIAILESS